MKVILSFGGEYGEMLGYLTGSELRQDGHNEVRLLVGVGADAARTRRSIPGNDLRMLPACGAASQEEMRRAVLDAAFSDRRWAKGLVVRMDSTHGPWDYEFRVMLTVLMSLEEYAKLDRQ